MSPPRLFLDTPVRPGAVLSLPPRAARHVQVLRLQPGAEVILFDGTGGQWRAAVRHMGRQQVEVEVGAHEDVSAELPLTVTLALAMPANDRMDAVVEKATELGVAALQPLVSERSVLRLDGERAERKVGHWQQVAAAACEQSGRNRVPRVGPVRSLMAWLADAVPTGQRLLLSLGAGAQPLATRGLATLPQAVVTLSGPEGGLTPAEEAAARQAGFEPVTLGPRVLRADTAPLAVLAWLAVQAQDSR